MTGRPGGGRRRPGRLTRAAAAVPVALAALSVLVAWAAPAGAQAPTKVGWWNEANAGSISAPAPPSVPNGGLYVQNGPGGPMAVSAVEFSIPSGATVGNLKLAIAGNPVITQPPVACPITGASFTPAQNGSWAQKPTWDCSKTQVTGALDPAQTSVTFDAGKLTSGSLVSVVILAGGPADQIAFSPPGNDALDVTAPSDQSSSLPAADSSGAGMAAPSDSGTAPASPANPVVTDFASGPASGDATGTAALPAPAVAAPSSPAGGGTQVAAAPRYGYRPSSASSGSSRFPRTSLATGLGLAAMIVALGAYTLGIGPLGGRIQPLSARSGRQRRQEPA